MHLPTTSIKAQHDIRQPFTGTASILHQINQKKLYFYSKNKQQ